MKKLAIIDGNAIVHRAYHAIPPMNTGNGIMVNAVYGFTSMLLKVWKDIKPDYIAVTFDMAGPTFRHEKFGAYKGTRVKADQELYDQIPLAHEVVKSFGLPVYEKKGYEADDVIGTIVNKMTPRIKKEKDLEIYIVTGDMDTLQLIRDGVKVYTLRKGMSDIVVYDAGAVTERFGFGPEAMIDYKALRGDVSDNIPGVPGIGEKTAEELIKKFGTVENIYKKLDKENAVMAKELKPGVYKKLVEGKESAMMSKDLATIDQDVPDTGFDLEKCKLLNFDRQKAVDLFQKLEFVSLAKRLPGTDNVFVEKAKPTAKSGKKIRTAFKFAEIKDENEAEKLADKIKKEKIFSARCVLNGPETLDSDLLGAAFVVGDDGYYIDASLKCFDRLLDVFSFGDIELIGHDLKELVKSIKYFRGIEVKNDLFDTMVASYLLNPGSRAHDITSLLLKFLGKAPSASSAQTNLFGVDKKGIAEELFLITRTKTRLAEELHKADNSGLFKKVEMALIPVLAEMELNGVAVDLKMLEKLSVEAKKEIKKVSDKIYKMAGTEFNIGSPVQLREVLFDKLGISIEGVKKGKTGLSTSAEELEKLQGQHPIIDEISAYRELAKLQNTYIDVLPTLVNKKTGRIHTHFNQAVTATGRLSSSDPNLQNIPIRTELGREIRKAFVSEPGNTLISADYSQIELRIVASLAEDKKMIEIFERGEDIHKATAAAINDVPLDKVTKEMRYAAKEVNFGVLYGMGPYGLSWRAGISVAESKDFINKYFRTFSGVRDYIAKTLEFTKKEGYCETLFGRRRYIPELNASNFQLRSAAERMAINHPIQGTAADLMKMAMIEVQKKLHEHYCHPEHIRCAQCKLREGSLSDCPLLLLQVHDELVIEVKKELAEKVGQIVKDAMENVVKLRVPVKAEINIGHSWGDMK